MVVCCVCKKKSAKGNGISFFSFPKQETLATAWLVACGFDINSKNNTARKKVCSDHFLETSYRIIREGGPKILKPDAIPTIVPKKILPKTKTKNVSSVATGTQKNVSLPNITLNDLHLVQNQLLVPGAVDIEQSNSSHILRKIPVRLVPAPSNSQSSKNTQSTVRHPSNQHQSVLVLQDEKLLNTVKLPFTPLPTSSNYIIFTNNRAPPTDPIFYSVASTSNSNSNSSVDRSTSSSYCDPVNVSAFNDANKPDCNGPAILTGGNNNATGGDDDDNVDNTLNFLPITEISSAPFDHSFDVLKLNAAAIVDSDKSAASCADALMELSEVKNFALEDHCSYGMCSTGATFIDKMDEEMIAEIEIKTEETIIIKNHNDDDDIDVDVDGDVDDGDDPLLSQLSSYLNVPKLSSRSPGRNSNSELIEPDYGETIQMVRDESSDDDDDNVSLSSYSEMENNNDDDNDGGPSEMKWDESREDCVFPAEHFATPEKIQQILNMFNKLLRDKNKLTRALVRRNKKLRRKVTMMKQLIKTLKTYEIVLTNRNLTK